jgi:hypothetical protein
VLENRFGACNVVPVSNNQTPKSMKITLENTVTLETQPLLVLLAESSTLKFIPGLLPRRIETDLGNGNPFILTRIERNETTQEPIVAIFKQALGVIELRVLKT